ncbi:unnamed protein product [Allacma fusca]|uniref:Helitron helicase-like domain-containing protein n=1 Tax=Allacma fusca TaxID=39272 RepID=A0A8J2NYN6_9HEXA|nr:unnamed protein product [Allacma fusca]
MENQGDADRHREALANETSERRQLRLLQNAQRYNELREVETPEQRSARVTSRRDAEACQNRESRLIANAARHREARAALNHETRLDRSIGRALQNAQSRAAGTHEQRRDRLRVATTNRIRNNRGMYNAAVAGNALHMEEHALAFASMGTRIDTRVNDHRGPYVYKIHGQVYHISSPLHPQIGDSPKYAQLYILDPDEALRTRMAVYANKDCNENLMHELAQLLSAINNYAKAYKMMHEVEQKETDKAHQEGRPPREITMSIHIDNQSDRRRYNAPRFNEVAVIFRSDEGEPPFERDIRIYSRLHTKGIAILQAILNNDVDPMVYPILFPHDDR